MRIRKKAWAENELNTNKAIVASPAQLKGKWSEYFGNQNPIHIEIGCGKGQFISQMSKLHPDINYIGIEREEQIIVLALKKARLEQAGDNLAFVCGDASSLEDIFDTGEADRLYINFCDPWHRKRKWAKRRLTHRGFLSLYARLFGEKGGEVFLKTDNTVLFDFSLNEFADMGWRLHNISLDLHSSDYEGNVMTEYEEKFSQKGMPIYRLEAYYNKFPSLGEH